MIRLPFLPSRRIRGPKNRPARRRSGTGRPMALEPLESRALLAVTATLVGGDLVIAYNQAGDLMAGITSDGTEYTVSGTGLAATKFNVSSVTGVITVRDDAAIFGQEFKVNSGTALANALQVNANVESTSLIGGITTAKAGDVLIGSSAISLGNAISTAATNGSITLTGATTLTSGVSLSSGAGAGDITFESTLDGAQTLALTAGTGNVMFDGLVGNTTPLGAITLNSATNVTANGIRAASLTQVSGSGTTTLSGGAFTGAPAGTEAVRTNGAAGVSLTGTNLAVNESIWTSNGGTVTFNESGTITIAAAGDLWVDGAVSLTAPGEITTAGDIYTTNDNVTFVSATMLSGTAVIDTGNGAGNITFSNFLDGPHSLELTAGTGVISFADDVGTLAPLTGLSLLSAASTTFASTLILDGAAAASTGLSIASGVNSVTLNIPGSVISNFVENGIAFSGGSQSSTISGVTISNNGGSGIEVGAGDYAGTVIDGNAIEANGRHGIFLAGGGSVSVGRLVITSPGLNGSPLSGTSAAQLQLPLNPQSSTIQAIAAAGYPAVMPSFDDSGLTVFGTPPTSLQGAGIGGVENPGFHYQYAAQLAFEMNPTFPTNGFDGVAVYDAATSGTLSANPPTTEPEDAFLFYDFFVAGSGVTGLSITGNTIASNAVTGIRADQADHAGTAITGNTITNTGDGPYTGNGIALFSAGNVAVIDNQVDGSTLAGVYATGNLSGTVVQGNRFAGNRIGMLLENVTNAAFGGFGEDEGNAVIGGGDPLTGDFRDGIVVFGAATGSSIVGTDITDTATGVWLHDAARLELNETLVERAAFFGIRASGDLPLAEITNNLIASTEGIDGSLGHAISLDDATNLFVVGNTVSGNFGAGLYVTGDATGTRVENNYLENNRIGMFLADATSAVIGGTDAGEGNIVVGGSDAANNVLRDGIVVSGTLTDSSVAGTNISDTTTGVALLDAVGITIAHSSISGSEFLGVNASGTLTGSDLSDNTVELSGGLGFLGDGLYLANAAGLAVMRNDVNNNLGSGLRVMGATTNTVVHDNSFMGNRVGISLVDATDALVGGLGDGEGNLIDGGGDATTGDFRDGLVGSGNLTGSTVAMVTITNAATGIVLSSAAGLSVDSATVTGSQVWGLNANGVLTNTKVQDSTFQGTTDTAGGGAGLLVSAGQSLLIERATITGNTVGVLADGSCVGTSVIDTTSWAGNLTNVISTATGLTINPPAA